MIDAKTDLIDVLDLLADRRQILERGAGGRLRHVLQECRSQRIDAVCGDAIAPRTACRLQCVGLMVTGSQI